MNLWLKPHRLYIHKSNEIRFEKQINKSKYRVAFKLYRFYGDLSHFILFSLQNNFGKCLYIGQQNLLNL